MDFLICTYIGLFPNHFPLLPYITHFNQRVTFEDFYPYHFITRRCRKTSRAASNRASPSLVTLAPNLATLDLPRPMVALFGELLQRPDGHLDQSGLPLCKQTNWRSESELLLMVEWSKLWTSNRKGHYRAMYSLPECLQFILLSNQYLCIIYYVFIPTWALLWIVV